MGLIQSSTPQTPLKEDDDDDSSSAAAPADVDTPPADDDHLLLHQNLAHPPFHHKLPRRRKDEIEQEPELVPFPSSASPMSPHVSSTLTTNLRPSVRVWDPGHVLGPPPPTQSRSFDGRVRIPPGAFVGDEICTHVYVIRHGETDMNTLPGLIGGRTPSAMLSAEGKRQARALGVFLLSHGLHFDAVFSSPLERCKQTAIAVCQEVNFPQERIQLGDALVEMSQGQWEGLRRSEIYTPELVNVMANSHPDFHAPGGESQRQVEFRMVEFVNNVVLPKAVEANLQEDAGLYYVKQSKPNALMQVHPLDNCDEVKEPAEMVPPAKQRNLSVRGVGKSRLHITSNGNPSAVRPSVLSTSASESESSSEQNVASKAGPFYVAVFSHGMAIKCLLRGLLGSDPQMTRRLCIDNTSMTVLRHSTYYGWQIQCVNDTAHLRLL